MTAGPMLEIIMKKVHFYLCILKISCTFAPRLNDKLRRYPFVHEHNRTTQTQDERYHKV